ncbi:MAG: hypothetical protein WBP64_06795 [Nitrososphaeraceae archaeon]
MISTSSDLQISQAIVYFIAAAIPIYFIYILKERKIDDTNNNKSKYKHFRLLSIVLAGFVLLQGFYHLIGALGFMLLAKGVLEPLSFGILLFFGGIYFTSRSKTKKEEYEVQ